MVLQQSGADLTRQQSFWVVNPRSQPLSDIHRKMKISLHNSQTRKTNKLQENTMPSLSNKLWIIYLFHLYPICLINSDPKQSKVYTVLLPSILSSKHPHKEAEAVILAPGQPGIFHGSMGIWTGVSQIPVWYSIHYTVLLWYKRHPMRTINGFMHDSSWVYATCFLISISTFVTRIWKYM